MSRAARQFVVMVDRPGARPMVYAACEAAPAIRLMSQLVGQGLDVVARTIWRGVTQDLSLDRMRERYGKGVQSTQA